MTAAEIPGINVSNQTQLQTKTQYDTSSLRLRLLLLLVLLIACLKLSMSEYTKSVFFVSYRYVTTDKAGFALKPFAFFSHNTGYPCICFPKSPLL